MTAKDALTQLYRFQAQGDPRIFNEDNPFYEPGAEACPFFTEGYLYPLFEDKDTARELLGLLRQVVTACGYTEKDVV